MRCAQRLRYDRRQRGPAQPYAQALVGEWARVYGEAYAKLSIAADWLRERVHLVSVDDEQTRQADEEQRRRTRETLAERLMLALKDSLDEIYQGF
jgi:uncharacterized protein YcbX